MPLTVGTAGHIDHGKTWLVRALTGKDTDRLPEERARGISIDLGYAPLELPDGRRLSLVDVPGHERFVRTMIAGATGIDLFLLVIDAQEGARPQTHEHLAVLKPLGVEHGVVALTKADAVDEDARARGGRGTRARPRADVVAVSAKTGAGLDELREALARLPVRERDSGGATRLYVDRVFTLRGVGTVATGTLWSGAIAAGDELRVEPSGRTVRVRSVQVHDAAVDRAEAGQRVAVNLPQLERRDLARGDVLVAQGDFPRRTASTSGSRSSRRYRPRSRCMSARKRCPHAWFATASTRSSGSKAPSSRRAATCVVLRADTTVGGGTVLDPAPPRRLDRSRLEALGAGDAATFVHAPVPRAALQRLFSDDALERCRPSASSSTRTPGSSSCANPCTHDSQRVQLRARSIPVSRSRSSCPSMRGRSRCSTSSGTARRRTSRARRPRSATAQRRPNRSRRSLPKRRS
jgi:selenocysteine-specific elongation factor